MTGRNPWVVLCVAEDAPYEEVQRAFRRRVKQTHPDRGGNAGEFAAVMEAFEDVRKVRPALPRKGSDRRTPYDPWLEAPFPKGSFTDDHRPAPRISARPAGGAPTPPAPLGDSDFSAVLLREMSKALADTPLV